MFKGLLVLGVVLLVAVVVGKRILAALDASEVEQDDGEWY
jgi:FlaG/FlaF family flagellin (archaellin)